MYRRFVWQLCFHVAAATPQVAFPFNSQVPPVARVGETYSFTFASTTFKPNCDCFQYSLSGAPAWLSLDSKSRTLSGTPAAQDVGTVMATITASDGTGSAPMACTLVVVATPGPQLREPISDQLAQAGNLSGPTTLSCGPKASLTFAFSASNFAWNGPGSLFYYATMSDRTPLPAWLTFNAAQLRFTGVTPAHLNSPESFDILMIASDIAGFSGAWATFTVLVNNHQLYFNTLQSTINVGPNQSCNVNNLLGGLFLDGSPITNGNLAGASANLPPWLSFDPQTLAITGSAPPSALQQDVDATIIATDKYGDIANTTLQICFAPALSNGSGKPATVTILASAAASRSIPTAARSSARAGATRSSASASTDTSQPELTKESSKRRGMIAGISITGVSTLMFIALALWRCRSPRKHFSSVLKRNISKPYINNPDESGVWDVRQDAEDIEDIEKAPKWKSHTPEPSPQIALRLSPAKSIMGLSASLLFSSPPRKPANRQVDGGHVFGEPEKVLFRDASRFPWAYGPANDSQDLMRLASYLARTSQISPIRRARPRRGSLGGFAFKDRYRWSTGSIPVNAHLSGAGHGRTSPGCSRNSYIPNFAQNRVAIYAADFSDTASPSSLSTGILTSFPPPPRSKELATTPSRRSSRTSRTSRSASLRFVSSRALRPIPRRRDRTSTFFAGGFDGDSSRRRTCSNPQALGTIHDSPTGGQMPWLHLDDGENESKPNDLIVIPGDGSSPPPQAIISPSGSDHLLQSPSRRQCLGADGAFVSVRAVPPSRDRTVGSKKTAASWTTTCSSASSALHALPPPPIFALLPPPRLPTLPPPSPPPFAIPGCYETAGESPSPTRSRAMRNFHRAWGPPGLSTAAESAAAATAAAQQEPTMGERITNAHRRFQERLRRAAAAAAATVAPPSTFAGDGRGDGDDDDDVFGGPLSGRVAGTAVPASLRSSVVFADADEDGDDASGTADGDGTGATGALPRDDMTSVGSDLLSYAGTPEPATAVVGTKGRGRIVGLSPAAGSIMARPRASYRVACAGAASANVAKRRAQKATVGTIAEKIEKGAYNDKDSTRVVAGSVKTAFGVEESEGNRLRSSKGSVTSVDSRGAFL